jgi:hypothetical protein
MPDFLASDLQLHLHQMGFGVVQCTAGNVQGTGSFVRNLLDFARRGVSNQGPV